MELRDLQELPEDEAMMLDELEQSLVKAEIELRCAYSWIAPKDVLALIACVRAADAWFECAPEQDLDKWKAWKEARAKLETGK